MVLQRQQKKFNKPMKLKRKFNFYIAEINKKLEKLDEYISNL